MLYHRVIFGALIAASASVTTAVPVRDSGDALDARMAKLEEKVKKLAPTLEYGIKEQGVKEQYGASRSSRRRGAPSMPQGPRRRMGRAGGNGGGNFNPYRSPPPPPSGYITCNNGIECKTEKPYECRCK